jgi:phosphatidylinositol alpha-1,6-mannosyltransferase
MTRSLWITNDLPPRAGGIEQFLGNLLRRLDGDQTRVLASRADGDLVHDGEVGYDVRRIARWPLLPTPAVLRRVRAEIADFRPEVVVFGAAWPLAELATRLEVPSVALTHGHEAGMVSAGGGRLVRRALRGVSTVTTISEFTSAALRPWLPPGATLADLPPGVDTDTFHPSVDGAAIRERHGLPPDAPLAVCIGRVVRRKGQDILVESWPAVLARMPEARLLIGGTGPLRPQLERRVASLGLGHRVLLVGRVDWDDLPAYHRAADVFAMPGRTRLRGLDVEGLGIVYLEAQASGVPVIAGRSGGAPEALLPGRSGLVVDGTDTGAVAEAVTDLLDDPERRAAMGAAGREFVTKRYAWPAIAERLREILEETTAVRRAR